MYKMQGESNILVQAGKRTIRKKHRINHHKVTFKRRREKKQMDEQSRIILYKQLMKFEMMSKVKGEKLIPWEAFCDLDKKEALEYASDYRDRCSEEFNRRARKSERRPLYLELPEMNFEGEDLSDFYLHDFMPGYARERSNGKKIFITTKVNLKDTNCVINMGTIRPIILSLDRKNNKRNQCRY